MKRNINLSVIFTTLLLAVLCSCKREIPEVSFLGGKSFNLTASVTGQIPLDIATQNQTAITLNWTNPDYNFSNGVSSQDVKYSIEIDTVGANFTSPKKQIFQVVKQLSFTFTQRQLNTTLYVDMERPIGVTDSIEIRVIATMSDLQATRILSNTTLTFKFTPYYDPNLVPPDLYITGEATPSNWTNTPPAANQKFTYLGGKKYELTTITMGAPFATGKMYKFLTTPGQWQPQYGVPKGTTGDGTSSGGSPLAVNDGSPGSSDPDAIPTPAVAGDYKITVNLGDNTFKLIKL